MITTPGVPATGVAVGHRHAPTWVPVAVAFYGRTNQGAVDEQVADFRRHVLWHRGRWLALMAEYGLRVVLVMLACQGAWLCRRWWLHPDWPRQVDELTTYLNEPSRHPVPEAAATIQEFQRQERLANSDEVRQGLLAGPDLLDAHTAADCYWLATVLVSIRASCICCNGR